MILWLGSPLLGNRGSFSLGWKLPSPSLSGGSRDPVLSESFLGMALGPGGS
jgi:hypothetical protein